MVSASNKIKWEAEEIRHKHDIAAARELLDLVPVGSEWRHQGTGERVVISGHDPHHNPPRVEVVGGYPVRVHRLFDEYDFISDFASD